MPAQLPLASSPYLDPYEAKQYRKHYKHLDNDAKAILDIHDFYTRPAKKGYCFIDDLLTTAYYPSADNASSLVEIGTADFYNMPAKKGYVLGENGILYTARLDRMNGEGVVDGGIPKGFKGYFLTANVNQWAMIDRVWKRIKG